MLLEIVTDVYHSAYNSLHSSPSHANVRTYIRHNLAYYRRNLVRPNITVETNCGKHLPLMYSNRKNGWDGSFPHFSRSLLGYWPIFILLCELKHILPFYEECWEMSGWAHLLWRYLWESRLLTSMRADLLIRSVCSLCDFRAHRNAVLCNCAMYRSDLLQLLGTRTQSIWCSSLETWKYARVRIWSSIETL